MIVDRDERANLPRIARFDLRGMDMDTDSRRTQAENLKRCTKCLLPETFPFIEYDEQGVCNYCRHYAAPQLLPLEQLNEKADRIRRNDGAEDCIVMFSGGRDSSFLLHYVVTELKLRPLAFTYDWGMSTPVGEENAARMCEKLHVKRIVIDGNTKRKLRNVRLNVNAWKKRPSLGMVPLFMAGDKHFFASVNRIARQANIDTVFIGTNPFEKTDFKAGFCGVQPNFQAEHIHSLTSKGKSAMIRFYLKEFLKNPAYINASLWETATAFLSFYNVRQEQIDLYHYVMWDEDRINGVLMNEYGWRMADDTPTTWRIGDGTAAFYNYIYHTAAGFTENDTLRSNQIRCGVLTREDALLRVNEENKPRFDSIRWYLDRIGVDYESTMRVIDGMPRLY